MILDVINKKYITISKFNSKGELVFPTFKLVYSKKNDVISYIYSTNRELISTFPEFIYTSDKKKEAKAIYTEQLFNRLVGKEVDDINVAIEPKDISVDGFVVICPRCEEKFKHADRCPNCGQLIKYADCENDNEILSMKDIENLFDFYNITYNNTNGNYRIMGGTSGSSLNLNKNNYVIYTTDYDFSNIVASGLVAEDLKLEPNVNSRDGVRPNKVSCTSRTTLRNLMEVFAKNSDYK